MAAENLAKHNQNLIVNQPVIHEQMRSAEFVRLAVDSDGNGRRNGTGLGLYITRKIVEMHGGSITVTSSDTEGTTFTIELPSEEETPN